MNINIELLKTKHIELFPEEWLPMESLSEMQGGDVVKTS